MVIPSENWIHKINKHNLLNGNLPVCIACDYPLIIKHILLECADTVMTREQFYDCPDLKTLISSVTCDTILAYFTELNLVNNILILG